MCFVDKVIILFVQLDVNSLYVFYIFDLSRLMVFEFNKQVNQIRSDRSV